MPLNDACEEALNIARSVINEACKPKKETCRHVIGTIGAAIWNHFTLSTEDEATIIRKKYAPELEDYLTPGSILEKYNAKDKGGMQVSIKSKQAVDTRTVRCTGTVKHYIKSWGFVQYIWDYLRTEQPEPSPVMFIPPKPTEKMKGIYITEMDLKGLSDEWNKVIKIKDSFLEDIKADAMLKEKGLEIINFSINGVLIIPRDEESTEADIYVEYMAMVRGEDFG